MDKWSAAKEQQLNKLKAQIVSLEDERSIAVDALVDLVKKELSGDGKPVNERAFAHRLIHNADELRDLLYPFDSGVRAG